MARKIFVTADDLDNFVKNCQAQLDKKGKEFKTKKFQTPQDKKITLTYNFDDVKDDRKARLEFTHIAWRKIQGLVTEYSTEVEWHGTVERTAENVFLVKDILVFPHKVTAASVESDQKTYEKWLMSLDDETFSHLRLHGHSHVNMGVSPSAPDMQYRKNMLNNFGTPNENTDLFYIFIIVNKRGEITGEIYDLQNNALYSTEDITFVYEGDDWLIDFIKQAKEMTTPSTPAYAKAPAPKDYYGGYNGSLLDDNEPDPLDDEYYGYGYSSRNYSRYRGKV